MKELKIIYNHEDPLIETKIESLKSELNQDYNIKLFEKILNPETKKILEDSLKGSQIIKKGDYSYFIHPLCDGIPSLDPELLNSIIDYIIINYDLKKVNKILTVESMGIPLATTLSLKTGIPLVIIRKRSYGLEDEKIIKQETGYRSNELYLNNIHKNDHLFIIDDVVSTGGTMIEIIKTLQEIGVTIENIFIPINKNNGIKKIIEETNTQVDYITNLSIQDDEVILDP